MAQATSTYEPRLKTLYRDEVASALKTELGLSNFHEVPKLKKVTVAVGLGRSKDDKRMIETATNTVAKITGQQPIKTVARKSIASFKLRDGNIIGLKVTLRGDKMYEFVDRMIAVVLPRMRDFHGVSVKSFDGRGGYSIGLVDQSVFPELSFEETSVAHGVQITIDTTGKDKEQTRALLTALGMPFEKENK
jgi:large subunit ribosomal protein L5